MDRETGFEASMPLDVGGREFETYEGERGRFGGGFSSRGGAPMRSSRAQPRPRANTRPRAKPKPRPRPRPPYFGTTFVGGWPLWPDRGDVRDDDAADRSDEPAEPPSEFIRWVQSALNRIEGLRLPVSGVMDAAARSALRRFQRSAGLPADGYAGPDTVDALRGPASSSRSRPPDGAGSGYRRPALSLSKGPGVAAGPARRRRSAPGVQREAPGAAVAYGPAAPQPDRASRAYAAWLQAALNRALGLGLSTDGIVGPLTRAAIRDFQSRRGLVASGVPGADLDAALMRAGAPPPPSPSPPVAGAMPPPAAAPIGRTGSPGTRFISVASKALVTPPIEAAVKALDAHFERAGLNVALTSALRPPQDQLRLIRDQAIKRGLDRLYPSITTATVENVDSWLDAWDDLLHRQRYVINPPVSAVSRITGKTYNASPHTTGLAFDLSGADLDRIAAVVAGYCREGGPVRQILIERRNNAVHVGLDAAGRSGACAVSVSN